MFFSFTESGFGERIDRAVAEVNNRIDALKADSEAEVLEARELFRVLMSMMVFSDALGLINAILYRADLTSMSSTVRHLFVVFLTLSANLFKSFASSQFIDRCFCKAEDSL